MSWSLILSAIQNEIQIEKYFYSISDLKPEEYNYLPRIIKLKSYGFFNLVKRFGFFIRLIWPFFFAPVCFFVFLVVSVFSRFVLVNSNTKEVFNVECDSVFSSNGECSFIKAKKYIDSNKVIILGDFSKSFRNDNSKFKFISPCGVVGFFDLFVIFFVSVFYNLRLLAEPSTRQWVMQGYVIFSILLRYRALYLLKKNVIIVDHFDRWAVLTDKVASAIQMKENKKISFTIIQHGILTSNFSDYSSTLPFELITKLNNVTDMIVYDELSRKIFLDKVLSNQECHFTILPPILNLYLINSEKVKLLFIGHSVCLKNHIELYLRLKNEHPKVDFFYKPHPCQVMDENTRNLGWKVHDQLGHFPDVDVVVSYPSTLAYEYHLAGKRVIQHSIYDTTLCVSSIIVQINEELKKRTTLC